MRPTFELCAETLEACEAARLGGADRVELCVNLHLDGTTPPDAMIAAAVERSGLPVHVLVRPEADDFVYRPAVFARIREGIVRAKELGAAGVVVGVLNEDRTVAVHAMRELVELASPLPVEFHRAFDRTPDLFAALEDVIATGCARVLTSGGAPDVIAGAAVLDALVRQAAGRIAIAAGGGLRVSNVGALQKAWTGQHYHGSLGGAADGVQVLAKRVRDLRAELAH
ncbi:copper homeostasis protein CutC [Terriglobus aquaticus]|uniref:PF03932 family protein CutC n=1 Tax=Terriglobus aquaticus TaxID=940139 RepID=A0ABW9KGU0_9BACT|nr:copper homeostasis protein CutC [Terriglobus aquaticus]